MKLRFFGRLRGLADNGERDIDLPPAIESTEGLRALLGRDHPELLDPLVRIAIDDRVAHRDEPLGDAREIAFLPPVSGG
ncbi:MAG: MoaD/ThiS family protein [Sphingomonas sp.]|nr:MoaD/ThiS family protein [Sphingomonas sp.]